jgi:hypothetical protein
MSSTEHRITAEEVRTHLAQPYTELICCQSARGLGSKTLYAVIDIVLRTMHFTVNGQRYDDLEDAVNAYNTAFQVKS